MHFEVRQDLLGKLAAVPHQVEVAARAAASRPTPPGGWPPVVIIGHLTRVDATVWLARLEQMAREDDPHWQWWEEPEFDWVGTYGGRTIEAAVTDLANGRDSIVDRLRNLDEAGWQRVGTHATFGRLDVLGLGREILVHDAEHIAQLALVAAP